MSVTQISADNIQEDTLLSFTVGIGLQSSITGTVTYYTAGGSVHQYAGDEWLLF